MVTEKQIIDALSHVLDPELGKDLVSLNMIKDVKINNGEVEFTLVLTTPACPLRNQIETSARNAVLAVPEVKKVSIKVDAQVRAQQSKPETLSLTIKHIIAVGSGKGGVGKSTISVNLAIALEKSGAKVGLLDADIYGPNIPKMMGIAELPKQAGQKIIPAEAYSIKVMSTGFLVKKDQPLIWRGPLLHSIMRQFFEDVQWGDLDYLVVDLPPGTGDVQLSLSQLVSISGGVIVTTPQEVSLDDAGRALVMYQKMNIPILGVIENMGGLVLPDGNRMDIFGSGGGKKLADANCVAFLGSIDLDIKIREGGDDGHPILVSDESLQSSQEIRKIAGVIAGKLSIQTHGITEKGGNS
jgi:ATP-binding protein involved in chromosome partitioning